MLAYAILHYGYFHDSELCNVLRQLIPRAIGYHREYQVVACIYLHVKVHNF